MDLNLQIKQFMMLFKKIEIPFSSLILKLLLSIVLIGPATRAFSQVQLSFPSPVCKDSTKSEKNSAWTKFITERETNPVYVGYSVLEFVNQQCNLSSGEKLIKLFNPYLQDYKDNIPLIRIFSNSIMRLVNLELSLLNNPQWNFHCYAGALAPVDDLLYSSNFVGDSYLATLLTIIATEVAVKEFTLKLEGLCEDRAQKDLIRTTLKDLTDFKNNFPEFQEIVKNLNQNRSGSLPHIRLARQKLIQILYR